MRYLYLLLLPFLPACEYTHTGNEYNDRPGDSTNWRRLDFGAFSVKAPGDWVRYSLNGIDSYVAGLGNDKDSLVFDYGWYSEDVSYAGCSDCLFATATIDGFPAVIRIPEHDGVGECQLHIDFKDGNKFSLIGTVGSNRTVLAIYQSLHFRHGHPAETDSLSLVRFTGTNPPNGRKIFYEDCAACHARYKVLTGPPLSPEFLKPRSNEWIFRFLTDRSAMTHDSLWRATSEQYNHVECQHFPTLTRPEVDALLHWLRQPQPQGY